MLTHGLSILVPVYNGALYIGSCLESILQQMQPHHQLVIVDDGSTDDTADCIQKTIAKYPNYNVVSLRIENLGVANARNLLLAHAHNEYIVFIDGDDLLYPDALSRIENVIEQFDCDVILTDACRWDPRTDQRKITGRCFPTNQVLTSDNASLQRFFADNLNYVWAAIAKRSLWNSLGTNCFEVGMTYEDLAVIARLIHHAETLVYVPEIIIDYRETPTSIVKTPSAHNLRSMVKAATSFRHMVDSDKVSSALKLQVDALATKYFTSATKQSFGLPYEIGSSLRQEMREQYLNGLFFPVETVLRSMKSPTKNQLLITEKMPKSAYRKASFQAERLLNLKPTVAWFYTIKLSIRQFIRSA